MKLILSDLDGTLLKKGEAALPPETFSMIETLDDRGILFAVASGRTYHELRKLFAPVARRMAFIGLDGALAVYGEETVAAVPVPAEAVTAIWRQSMAQPGGLLLLCARERTYYRTAQPAFAAQTRASYGAAAVPFGDPAEADEPVYKLMYAGEPLAGDARLSQVYGGNGWQEWVAPGVDKGAAAARLQRRLRIPPSECMAFGDADNDIEMLRQVGCRFAMNPSSPRVRAMCDRRVQRVEDTVLAYLGINRREKR